MQRSDTSPLLPAKMATSSTPAATSAATGSAPNPLIALRIQSGRLYDDESLVGAEDMKDLLSKDLQDRVTEVGEALASDLFPDEAFGFPINDQFVKNFCGSFISTGRTIVASNFTNEVHLNVFLNRMVATIGDFLEKTKSTSLVPLRYFSIRHATTPIKANAAKLKPDVILASPIDSCTQDGILCWKNVKCIIEHTREARTPNWMGKTVSNKSYLIFNNQPDRDFAPSFCITGKGIHIVVTDRAGQVETDLLPFDRTSTAVTFVRMVMGFTFLPNSYLGFDATMTRLDGGVPLISGKFSQVYPPFELDIPKPRIQPFISDPSTIIPSPSSVSPPTVTIPLDASGDDKTGGDRIVSIVVNSTTYKVKRLIFRAQSLVGRATRAFLVELPDGRSGIIKDSWITNERMSEAGFLNGLDIPCGPQLINHCILRDTGTFRANPIRAPEIKECREKRRIVTYPAGVHISDFSSLWELMAAFLDIVIGRAFPHFLFRFFFEYTFSSHYVSRI
jgi:hypothetical protein